MEEARKKFKILVDDKKRDAENFQKEFEQMIIIKQQEAEKIWGSEKKNMLIELDQKEFEKKMFEKQQEIEEKTKTDEERKTR